MKKAKVLHLIDRGFLGGGQRVLLSLARHLSRERFDVAVAAEAAGPLAAQVERLGLPFFPIDFRDRPRQCLRRLLTGEGFDLLHTHGGRAGFFGRLAAAGARTPARVHTLHGIHYLHYPNPLKRRAYILLERSFSRRTDAVICVSRADREAAAVCGLAPEGKLHLIYNGVEPPEPMPPDKRERRRRELGLLAGEALVVTVARLHRQKGVIHLVRAAERLERHVPTIRFLVVGGGPQEEMLKEEAVRLGVEKRLFFLGERSDAGELLALGDLFVLPSLWEGLPLVLVEAAGLAMPVVATAVDGVREVIRDGENGLLVPPADPAAMAEAISRMLRERSLAEVLGRRAREDIPPRFSIGRQVEETEALYLEILERKGFKP